MFLCLLRLERSALAALRKDLRNTLRSAYSVGTYVNLKTQFKAYLLFCSYFRLTPAPAELDTICLYGRVFTMPFVSLNIPEGVLFADLVKRLKHHRCFHEKVRWYSI